MTDNSIKSSIVRTKLHRPVVDKNHVHRERLLTRLDQHRDRPLTLVSAPAGYGKSVLISCWLASCDDPGAWLSLDKDDNDLRTFLSYFIAAIRTLFPKACPKTQALLGALDLPPIKVLSTSLLNELDRIEQSCILVLDDYYLIKDVAVHDLISALLSNPPQNLHLVIVGRYDPPLAISRLRGQGLMTELRTIDLRFNHAEIETYLTQVLGLQVDEAIVAALGQKIEGWVTGLRLAALSMRHQGKLDSKMLEPQVGGQYVLEYLFTEVFSRQPPEINQYLLNAAVLYRFCGPLCEALCGSGEDSFECRIGGWEFIAWLKKENMFLIPLDAENRWFRFHHLFQKLLFNQLMRHRSSGEIKTLHARASAWFAENDLLEEAITHALAAGDPKAAGCLVARFSYRLMNDQQWPRLERCLAMLSPNQIEQDPALLILEGWLHHIRQNMFSMVSCIKKTEALIAVASSDALANLRYVRGHLEAMRAFQHFLSGEGEKAMALSQRALQDMPLEHKRARLFADIFHLGACQMLGQLETGLSLYQEVMGGIVEHDKSYHAVYLGNLGLVYWMDANLVDLRRTAECVLDLCKEDPLPEAVPSAGYSMGIVQYHRNELKSAEEFLIEVVRNNYASSPMQFAHSSFALALTYQAQGRPDRARAISREVVANSIETNNLTMLQISQAFEAELALRQGRLAVALLWAEKYKAKPFLQPYRFYMPQLTLAKILLAQDTTVSRTKAADLLDQLYDFLTGRHNTRFLIDVLALQALLHHERHNESAAIKALTSAIDLAAPSRFIRLFVDLGPRMADLLTRLIDQNTAVDYGQKILAAFRGDAPAPDSQSAKPPVAQPLIDPLTNRELDILVLLSERLRNKEIADRLFIAPDTVKKHLGNIYKKLDAHKRQEAVEKAMTLGLLTRR